MLSKDIILNIIRGDVKGLCRFLDTEIELDLAFANDKHIHIPFMRRLFIEAGAYSDELRFRRSLLHVAVATRNIEFLKLLLEAGCDINSRNQRGQSALHLAIINEFRNISGSITDQGANFERVLDSADSIRRMPLTKFILDHGADVNSEDSSGESPLHFATNINNPTIARVLLEKGACVNKHDMYGNTPLFHAVRGKNISLIELLLDNGADVSSTNSLSATSLVMAAYNNDDTSYDIIKLLLERGANCNERKYQLSVLSIALINCVCRTVKLLLDNGAVLRLDEQRKATMLHCAAMNRCADVIEYILDLDFIDVNVRNDNNETALNIAIETSNYEGCKLLLSRGANVDCIDDNGNTPLYLAVLYEKFAKIKLLLEYGTKVYSKHPSQNAIMNLAKYQDIRVRNILIEHVAKLISLNTWVSEIELEAIEKDFKMKSYYEKCIKELEKMKICKIYEDVCLFNILMKRGMSPGYARNEELIGALDSAENQLKHDFPIFYSLLKNDFDKEIKKQKLVKGAAINLNKILNFYDPLHFANLKILGYLNEEDIIRIIETE